MRNIDKKFFSSSRAKIFFPRTMELLQIVFPSILLPCEMQANRTWNISLLLYIQAIWCSLGFYRTAIVLEICFEWLMDAVCVQYCVFYL